MTQPDELFPDSAVNASPGFAAYAGATQTDWETQIRNKWLDTLGPFGDWLELIAKIAAALELEELKACLTNYVGALTDVNWLSPQAVLQAVWASLHLLQCMWQWFMHVLENLAELTVGLVPFYSDLAAFLGWEDFKACWAAFTATWETFTWTSLDSYWTAFVAFIDYIQCVVTWAISVIQKLFGIDLQALHDAFAISTLIGCFTTCAATLAGINYTDPGALNSAVGAVMQWFKCLGNWAVTVINNLAGWNITTIKSMFASITAFINTLVEYFLGADALALWTDALDWFTGLSNSTIVGAIAKAFNKFKDLVGLFGPLTGLGTGTVGLPSYGDITLFSPITDFIQDLFTNAGTLLDNAVTQFLNFFSLNGLADLQDWMTGVRSQAEDAYNKFVDLLTHFELTDIPGLTGLIEAIQTAANTAIANWTALLENFELTAIAELNTLLSDLQTQATTAYTQFEDLLTGTAQTTIAGLAGLINGLVGESLGDLLTGLSLADIPALATYLADAKAKADLADANFTALLDGIGQDIDGLVSQINGLAENALGSLLALIPGVTDIPGLATWLTDTKATADGAADKFADLLTGTSQTTVAGLVDWMQDAGNIVTGTLAQAHIPALTADWGKQIHGSLLAGAASIPGSLLTGNIAGGLIQGALTNANIAGTAITSLINQANIPALTAGWGKTIHGALLTGSVATSLLSGYINGAMISGALNYATIAGSRITGYINANIISGALTYASIAGSQITGTINATLVGVGIAVNKVMSGLGYANLGADLTFLNTAHTYTRDFINTSIIGPLNNLVNVLRFILPGLSVANFNYMS